MRFLSALLFNTINKLILLILIFHTFLFALYSQNEFAFEHFSNKQGLSQNVITDIMQDSSGILWIGTQHGLNIYDGIKFKKFYYPNQHGGFMSNNITFIKEDKDKNIWIGTFDKGVIKITQKPERFSYFQDSSYSNQSKYTLSFYESPSGMIFAGTIDGLYVYNKDEDKFIKIGLHHTGVTVINAINPNKYIVGTRYGLQEFNYIDGKYIFKPLVFHKNINQVTKILKTSKGDFLIGTSSGLYIYDSKKQEISSDFFDEFISKKLEKIFVISLLKDSDNNFWIGTNSGLYFINNNSKKLSLYKSDYSKSSNISYNIILSMFQDRSRVLWFGTGGIGLNKLSLKKNKFSPSLIQKENDKIIPLGHVSSIFDEKNFLWVGLYSNEIFRLNKQESSIKKYNFDISHLEPNRDNFISSLFRDSRGDFWAALRSAGIYKYDKIKDTFIRYVYKEDAYKHHNCFIHLSEEKDKRLWIGKCTGIDVIDHEKNKLPDFKNTLDKIIHVTGNVVYDIITDKNMNVWIGTKKGLIKYNLKDGQSHIYLHDFKNKTSLSDSHIQSLFEDSKGRIWIGTYSNGLNRYNAIGNDFKRYSTENGLPDNAIYAIIEDNSGYIWLTTNNGVSQLDPQKEKFYNYDHNDGLQSLEFNHKAVFKGKRGKLFFGGTNGIDTIIPENVKKNTYTPPIIINSLKIENKELFQDKLHYLNYNNKQITFSYKVRTIFIGFAALDYNNPGKNQYAYKIENIDNDWNRLGTKNSITLTNTAPGNYRIRIIGSNNDSWWNKEGAFLDLIIVPPFWATIWFKLIVLSLLIMLLFLFYKMRINRLKRKIQFETKVENMCSKKNLTNTEKEIVFLILRGKTNLEIEEALFITQGSIRNYISNIYKKFNVKNRMNLIKQFKDLEKLFL